MRAEVTGFSQWMYGVTASCSVSPRTAEEGAECLPGGAKGKCELAETNCVPTVKV